MDNRTLVKYILLLTVTALAVTACDNPNAVPTHSAADDKAINALKSMTPQQQIDLIQKGPMPPSAKASMIKKIKDKNGIP
jgi:hypothetical protein